MKNQMNNTKKDGRDASLGANHDTFRTKSNESLFSTNNYAMCTANLEI